MSLDSPVPHTPPQTRHSSLASGTRASTPPSPHHPKHDHLPRSFFVLSDADDSEDESPIKNRELWRDLSRKGRHSLSEDSSFVGTNSFGKGSPIVPQRHISTTPTTPEVSGTSGSRRPSTRPDAERYVPPHLRRSSLASKENVSLRSSPFLPSIGKNSFSAFDRSAVPAAEDSFYTFSNESMLFSRFSTVTSTPNTSHEFTRSAGVSPSSSKNGIMASPPPRSLSRSVRLDVSCFEHPRAIPEEEISEPDSEAILFEARDDWDVNEPAGPVLPLESIATDCLNIDSNALEMLRGQVEGEECCGCGVESHATFVIFIPCRHSCCPDCLNAMVNGAAHKPPRPSDCFTCSHQVESFEPVTDALYSHRGGVGLAYALAFALQTERRRQRTSSRPLPTASTTSAGTVESELEEIRRLARTNRRRSSVVAAAIAASLLSRSRSKSSAGVELEGPTSPVRKLLFDRKASSSSLSLNRRHGSLADLPHDVEEEDSPTLQAKDQLDGERRFSRTSLSPIKWPTLVEGVGAPGLEWSSEPMATFSSPTRSAPRSRTTSGTTRSDQSDLVVSSPPPRPTEWPVVRIDNVPWSITVDEIEQWLPDGTLASDLERSLRFSENEEQVESYGGITLAVHILCNRTDGRTLNQAFIECISVEAAKEIVRLRDGTRLKGRPLHLAMSSQTELMTTVFPTYTPGFAGLDAIPTRKGSPSCPLILQVELNGLLALCTLGSPHSAKAPERPFFNLVSMIEKLPWHQPGSYTARQITRLYKTCAASIEILQAVSHQVVEFRDILTVLVDSILRCPAFRPEQKKKIVKLAAKLDFDQHVEKKTIDVFLSQPQSSRQIGIPFPTSASNVDDKDSLSPTVTPEKDTESHTATDGVENGSPRLSDPHTPLRNSETILSLARATLSTPHFTADVSPVPSAQYSFPPTPSNSHNTSFAPSTRPRQRRRSSIALQLGIDPSLVAAVAKELGIVLSSSSTSEASPRI